MKPTLCAWVSLALLFVANQSQAAVFERDWQAPGDGLLTYDNINQREWLDLTESRLSRFGPIVPEFPQLGIESQYQNALAETLPGGMFEGFTVAKRSDVITLAESAGIDTNTLDFATNQAAASELIDLVGVNNTSGSVRQTSWGMIDEFASDIGWRVSVRIDVAVDDEAGLSVFLGEPARTGVWLFRAVPEPSTFALATLAAATIARMQRLLCCKGKWLKKERAS